MRYSSKNPGVFVLAVTAIQIVLPVVIFLCTLAVKQRQHERISSASVPHLETIVLTGRQSEYFKTGDEVTYNGRQYDIRTASKSGTSWVITALPDNDETTLNELTVHLRGQNPTADTHTTGIPPFLLLYYETPVKWYPAYHTTCIDYPGFIGPALTDHTILVVLPPPRAALSLQNAA